MHATDSSPVGTRRWLVSAAGMTLALLVGCGGQTLSATGLTPDAAGSGSASTIPTGVFGGPSPVGGFVPGPGPLPGTTVAPGPTGATSAFCRDLNEQLAILPNLLGRLGSPDLRATALQQIKDSETKLVRDAPAAVRPDALTLARLYNRIIDDVSANPPNLDDVTKAFSDPTFQTASANVGRYAGQHCPSISPFPGTPPTT